MRVTGIASMYTADVEVCHLGNCHATTAERRCRCDIGQPITFDMLPDDILIEIFDFYVDEDIGEDFRKQRIQDWMTLVHVCRRWRSVVFQSPRRLNLRLFCTPNTPPNETLGIWPPLPLVIIDNYENLNVDNTIAALEHNDRVCQITLRCCSYLRLEDIMDSAAMQKPFPELTHLGIAMTDGFDWPDNGNAHDGPILPDSFLGGSAPSLRSLELYRIPFPALPNLLLSATHLVKLELYDIPHSVLIPPEAMATGLSALTSLQFLCLHFGYARPVLESRRPSPPPPPLTRSILPILTTMLFGGISGYLEEILARIDTPQLNKMHIIFFNQITSGTPQLFQFISRRPTLRALEEGHIAFNSESIIIKFPSLTSDLGVLLMQIPCTRSDLRLSCLEQVCTSSLPPVYTLEDLYILEDPLLQPCRLNDVENSLWIQLLHPFVAVKNLYLGEEFVPRFAAALQELVGRGMTEVLPTLENFFLEGFQLLGPLHEGIEKFVAARRLTSHCVTISRWDREPIQERQWEYWGDL